MLLEVDENHCGSYVVNNLDSIAKLDISLTFGLHDIDETSVLWKKGIICSFLTGNSKVRDMNSYLSRLYVYFYIPGLKWLLTFLESCPNLKSLILVMILLKTL